MKLYHAVTSMLPILADWTLRHLEDKTFSFLINVTKLTIISCKTRRLIFNLIQSKLHYTRVGTLIVATIYLQLIQNRYVSKFYCPSM